MRDSTRKKFNTMCSNMATTYNVPSVSSAQFAVAPTHEQKLNDKIVAKSSLLSRINVIFVDQAKGENILGSVKGRVSSRTNTKKKGVERVPRNVLDLEGATYECHKTDSDVAMPYETMDAWAKFPELAAKYTEYVQEAIATDRELIGFFGEAVAENSDMDANPNLEDVNKGWMQYMREKLPAHVITTGEKQSGEIRIGPGGDYENLDHAVADMKQIIPQYLRKDLVVLVGSTLVGTEESALYKANSKTPTEKTHVPQHLTRFAGLPWESPDLFPDRGLMITSLKNLSIYVQTGTWRRHVKDKPERNQVEDFNSRNEGYSVEDPRACVMLEFAKVKIPAQAENTWE